MQVPKQRRPGIRKTPADENAGVLQNTEKAREDLGYNVGEQLAAPGAVMES